MYLMTTNLHFGAENGERRAACGVRGERPKQYLFITHAVMIHYDGGAPTCNAEPTSNHGDSLLTTLFMSFLMSNDSLHKTGVRTSLVILSKL